TTPRRAPGSSRRTSPSAASGRSTACAVPKASSTCCTTSTARARGCEPRGSPASHRSSCDARRARCATPVRHTRVQMNVDILRRAARRLAARPWRVVEVQHRASTMRLVDTLAEQRLLEDLLEQGKPPLPAEAEPLHYLLATPFRYPAPPPDGSRFRGVGDPGVWYG